MTTVVSVAQGGTGSNSAALARTALGVPPSAAYDQANTARDQANTARTQANTGYDQANTARGQANTAYGQANTAYAQANSAYSDANTRLSASGGTLAGDLIITGNLTVSGNSTTLNAEILTIEDADIVLLSNVASTPALNAGIIVNRGTSTNTFLRWDEVTDKWGWSDDGSTTYKFNSALDAYAQANSAYGAANNTVLKAGDTMTGQLNISTGGLLVTGNTNIDSGTLFIDSVANRIGISTTNPTGKLNIIGGNGDQLFLDNTGQQFTQAYWRSNANAYGAIWSDSTNNLFEMYGYSGVGLTFSSNATERMRITNSGLIGIGTTNPTVRLHVSGDMTDIANGQIRAVGLTDAAKILALGYHTTNNYGFVTALQAGTGYSNLVLQGEGGNVGIGTTNPQGKQHNYLSSRSTAFNPADGATWHDLIIQNPNSTQSAAVGIAFELNSSYHSNAGTGIAAVKSTASSDYGADLAFITRPQNAVAEERMRIDSSGRVLIGTAAVSISSSEKFEVYGGMSAFDISNDSVASVYIKNRSTTANTLQPYLYFNDGGANRAGFAVRYTDATYHQFSQGGITLYTGSAGFSGERVTITSAGNVGIGTTNPSTILTISKAMDSSAYGSGTRAIDFKIYFPGYDVDSVKASIYAGVSNQGTLQTTKGYLAFLTSATSGSQNLTEKMRIEADGNVGIGTNNPSNKLDVWGDDGGNGVVRLVTKTSGTGSYQQIWKVGNTGSTVNDGYMQLYDNAVATISMAANASRGGHTYFNTGGNVGIGTTSFNTNGGKLQVADGISFPATQSACSDANTLDDYEEGTWTPELRDGATVLTQGYSYRSGVYHKIGRMVHIHFGFLLSSLSGTSTNGLRVYGLPFTGATTGGYQEPMGYAILGNQPTASHSNSVYFFNMSGTAILEARLLTGGDTVYTSNNIDGDTFMKFSMIYWV